MEGVVDLRGFPSDSSWKHVRTFDASFTMFGLLISVIILIKVLVDYSFLFLLLAIYLPVYYSVEFTLSNVMHKIATSSSFLHHTPYFLIPWFFVLGFLAAGGIYLLLFVIDSNSDFLSAYLCSLFESIVILLIPTAIKCLIVGSGLLNTKYTRRGFFGVFQRIFIIVKAILVIPFWSGFFLKTSPPPLLACFTMPNKTYPYLIYLALKGMMQLWMLWDLGFTIRDYDANSASTFRHVHHEEVEDECIICQDVPIEPVALNCGHIFCYQCLFRWLADHNTCPFCRSQVTETRAIEFGDGLMPIVALIGTF